MRQIIKSYHQLYDHFHEALQNSIDACEAVFDSYDGTHGEEPYEPEISVHVDVDRNEVTVVDNGVGMTLEEVRRYLFTPYATLKPGSESRQRGEKGVGNVFLAYGSEHYEFATRSMGGIGDIGGKIDGGVRWTLGTEEAPEMPLVEPAPTALPDDRRHGTLIRFRFSEQTNITRLASQGTTTEQWESILRLHTGVGYVDFPGGDRFLGALKISVYVIYQGEQQSKIAQKGYFYPHQVPGVTSVRLGDLTRPRRGSLPPGMTMKEILWDEFDSGKS